MARYVTTQPTDWDPDTAFAWMSDLRHLADWDPSIKGSEQIEGDGPAVGAEYDVKVQAAGGVRTMRYRIEELDREARTLLAISRTPVLTSHDRIVVAPVPSGGSTVTYDADLVLKGPLKLADPALKVSFDRWAMRRPRASGPSWPRARPRPDRRTPLPRAVVGCAGPRWARTDGPKRSSTSSDSSSRPLIVPAIGRADQASERTWRMRPLGATSQ